MEVGIKLNMTDAVKKLKKLTGIFAPLAIRRMNERIGIKAQAEINQNFRAQGNDEGMWKPLQPNTLANRRKLGKGARILRDSGRLAQSITYNVGAFGVKAGTATQYGSYHQDGTKGPYLITPKRAKFLVFNVAVAFTPAGGVAGAARIAVPSVMHPGLKKRPFLPSTKYAQNDIAKPIIDKMLEEAAGVTGGTTTGAG